MKKKQIFTFSLFILFLSYLVFPLFPEPPYKRKLDPSNRDPNVACSTTGYYDTNTAVTFFGDSRS